MNKKIKVLIPIIVFTIIIALLLNVKVITKYGKDYIVYEKQIPLYLKITSFIDRHFQYNELVREITKGCSNKQEKVMAILTWVNKNIKHQPKDLPVLDDHVWHTIVRGYGISDNFSDVFTTLCNYAGIDAFFTKVYTQDRSRRILLSFVRINGRWSVFDPYYGVYFKNKNGNFANIEEIKSKNDVIIETVSGKAKIEYTAFFNNLHSIKDMSLHRSNIQSPINRLLFELKKLRSNLTNK